MKQLTPLAALGYHDKDIGGQGLTPEIFQTCVAAFFGLGDRHRAYPNPSAHANPIETRSFKR
jgi:hypothetical protein